MIFARHLVQKGDPTQFQLLKMTPKRPKGSTLFDATLCQLSFDKIDPKIHIMVQFYDDGDVDYEIEVWAGEVSTTV